MTLLSALTRLLPESLQGTAPSSAAAPQAAPEWYAANQRRAGFLQSSYLAPAIAQKIYPRGINDAASGPDQDTALSEGFTCHPFTAGHLLGRRPGKDAQAMLTFARVVADQQVGLVVDLFGEAQAQESPTLRHRQGCSTARNGQGQPVATTQLFANSVSGGDAVSPSASLSDMKILTTKPGAEPQGQVSRTVAFQHLRLGTQFKEALSPEDTLAAVEFMERFRQAKPGQRVMTLCATGCDSSAQLAIARQLYERHRLGRLTPDNLDRSISELSEKLTLARRIISPAGIASVASLMAYGETLLQRPPASLVPATALQTDAPRKPPRLPASTAVDTGAAVTDSDALNPLVRRNAMRRGMVAPPVPPRPAQHSAQVSTAPAADTPKTPPPVPPRPDRTTR